jgi:large subunit ribosomal protein L25
MTKFDISADIRANDEKTSQIRQSKRVPAIVYGKTQAPISITVDSSDFLRLYRKAGESNIISLSVGKKKIDVLIHSTQKQPVTGEFSHVDFYAITQGEMLHAHIHLNFVWNSQAQKDGSIIEEYVKSLEVKCLPSDLVDHFDVDLSLLAKEGDVIRVQDLKISQKYELTLHSEDVIATATLPRAMVEAEESSVSEEVPAES